MEIDKRGKLQEEVFSYRVNKEGKVFIFWQGKEVKILPPGKAKDFLADVEAADEFEAQLIMAKATGNFKRGNEKLSKGKNRKR